VTAKVISVADRITDRESGRQSVRPRATRPRLPGSIAEIRASPAGPQVAAFFDFDGTLIAGFSASAMAEDRWRNRDISLGDLAKTIKAAARVGAGLADVEEFMRIGVQAWRGRTHEDMVEVGERVFNQRIADTIYPEALELVRAHQRRGHTVVLTSSAIPYQVEPMAKHLGIDQVLCTQLEIKNGLLTGEVADSPLWGPGKANAVQRFAQQRGIDLDQSYFYADGDEDVALMHLVGKPRPTNPRSKLAAVARRRGWPIQQFTSRGKINPVMRARSIAGFASIAPIAVVGGSLGLVKRDKRTAINYMSSQWFRRMFELVGVHLNVVGEEHLWSHRPAVFIFNHRTGLDPFIAASLVQKDFSGVAKKELEKDPVIGMLGRIGDIAFVDRGNTAKAIESLEPLVQLTKTKKLSVLASPEGTRVVGAEVGPFKKGPFRMAMAAGVPVVPIVIRNAEVLGPRNATVIRPGTVDVAVLPPISVERWKVADLAERIEAVRQQFLDTLEDWPG
jgi:putative phosphoserine phosphatase/1-acylglycerol-3-phosphate O-acyltransferase